MYVQLFLGTKRPLSTMLLVRPSVLAHVYIMFVCMSSQLAKRLSLFGALVYKRYDARRYVVDDMVW